MPDLASPFSISYAGGEAREHRIGAAFLGHSLQGTARVYNSVARYWFCGGVAKRAMPTIRVAAGRFSSAS